MKFIKNILFFCLLAFFCLISAKSNLVLAATATLADDYQAHFYSSETCANDSTCCWNTFCDPVNGNSNCSTRDNGSCINSLSSCTATGTTGGCMVRRWCVGSDANGTWNTSNYYDGHTITCPSGTTKYLGRSGDTCPSGTHAAITSSICSSCTNIFLCCEADFVPTVCSNSQESCYGPDNWTGKSAECASFNYLGSSSPCEYNQGSPGICCGDQIDFTCPSGSNCINSGTCPAGTFKKTDTCGANESWSCCEPIVEVAKPVCSCSSAGAQSMAANNCTGTTFSYETSTCTAVTCNGTKACSGCSVCFGDGLRATWTGVCTWPMANGYNPPDFQIDSGVQACITPTPAGCMGKSENCCGNSSWTCQGRRNYDAGCSESYRCNASGCSCGGRCYWEWKGSNGTWSSWTGCIVNCGQDTTRTCRGATCGGSCPDDGYGTTKQCPSTDTGVPTGGVTLVSPNGTEANPTIFLPGSSVNLSWNASADTLTDAYNIQVLNQGGTVVATKTTNTRTSVSTVVSGLVNGLYHWRVQVVNATCANTGVKRTDSGTWSSYGYFRLNSPPKLDSVTITNSVNEAVGSENVVGIGTSMNHICQTVFTKNGANSKIVTFLVNVSDLDGIGDLTGAGASVRLRLHPATGVIYNIGTSIQQTAPTTGMATFVVDFGSIALNTIYDIEVSIVDKNGTGQTGSYDNSNGNYWIKSGRRIKNWNCLIPISGSFYDGSAEKLGPSCSSNAGYMSKIVQSGFTLMYKDMTAAGIDKNMTITSPDYSSDFSNSLVWGSEYTPVLSGFPGNDPTEIRILDVGASTSTCSGVDFNLNINPYYNNPSVKIDFSSIMDQESWFQTVGGGVISKVKMVDNVPVTCYVDSENGGLCKPAMSISASGLTNGIISSPSVLNASGCGSNCKYGNPNDWFATNNLAQENYDYNYFYNKYFVNAGSGITMPAGNQTMTEIKSVGATGVVFVKGNLLVDENNTVPLNNFLMVVVNGTISIDPSVTNMDGIFVANGIGVGNSTPNGLVVNGSLYAANGDVQLFRGYDLKRNNNKNPAIIVNYRPDFIFSMPGKLIKTLSGWKQGI